MEIEEDIPAFKTGYNITIENAKKLLRVAEMAAAEKIFGAASSLCVLSAEESIKASILLMKRAGIEVEDYQQVFKKHEVKHSHLSAIFLHRNLVLKILNRNNSDLDKQMMKKFETLPEVRKKELKEKYSSLFKIREIVEKQSRYKFDPEDTSMWWKKANQEKNKGFYVDQASKGWQDPATFTKKQFDNAYKHATSSLHFSQMLNELFEGLIEVKRQKGMKRTPVNDHPEH